MNTKMLSAPYRKRAKRALRKLVRVGTGRRATDSMMASGRPRAFDRIYIASIQYQRARSASATRNAP